MAKAKGTIEDLRASTGDQLGDQLSKLKKEQFNLRFQRANGQLEKTNRVRVVRKQIARIMTVMNEQSRKAGSGLQIYVERESGRGTGGGIALDQARSNHPRTCG